MNEAFPNPEEKPETLLSTAKSLKNEYSDLDSLVLGIGNFLTVHAGSVKEPVQPKTIIESRFTPAEEAFEKGMLSCGSMVNMASEILQYLGYEVKLVHGEYDRSVDHAWILVKNPENGSWKEYDLTQPRGELTKSHIQKRVVSSWNEIKDQIEEDHQTLRERRITKGLIKEH